MFADGAAGEVGDRIGGPDNGEGEEEKTGTLLWKAVKTDGEGERKGNEEKSAGGDACGGKSFNERAAGEESEGGEAEDEEKKERRRRVHSDCAQRRGSGQAMGNGVSVKYPVGTGDAPSLRDQQKRTEEGPEAVGAVADGITESEIFPEGEDGEDGDSDSNGPGGGEDDDSDSDGQEDEGGENASEGHEERG